MDLEAANPFRVPRLDLSAARVARVVHFPFVFDYPIQFAKTVLLTLGALLPIVDPLGGAPIYLVMTTDLRPEQRAPMAKAVALSSFFLLMASTLVGVYVLDFFGLSIPAVQVAGGLVVCAIGWAQLNRSETSAIPSRATDAAMTPDSLRVRAFYPLTMPLTVGPGSVSVAITLGANTERGLPSLVITAFAHAVAVVIIAVSVYLCYRYAERLARLLGPSGTGVLMSLSAFILMCIGVQITWNGVRALLSTAFPHMAR